jgi:hypothetical protein
MNPEKDNFFVENRHLLLISLINFIIIYISTFTPGYGYFIDEFYYIACANNPAFGYVDHPPLAPFILMIYKFFFGESLYAIRIVPAAAASVTVFMAGIIARQLGGNKFTQGFASFFVLAAPVFAVLGGFYSMNAFEPMLCAISVYYILKMINEEKPEYWIRIGVLFGLLLMNKHTAGIFILFLVLSMLITPQRKYLLTKYFIYCVIISFLILLPNVLWQIKNGFPSLEFYITNMTEKSRPMPLKEFLLFQLFAYNPFLFPVWLAGLLFLLFNKKTSNYRFIGFLFLLSFIFFSLSRSGRVDRSAFAYAIIIPAGAVFIEFVSGKILRRWIYSVLGLVLPVFFIFTIPLLMPFLNYEKSAALTRFMGMNTELERGNRALMPQLLADRIGWQEKADMIGKIYASFPDSEKKNIIVAAPNYGNAGAIELFGKKYGIKNAVSGHNNYYLWSKERLSGDIVLQLISRYSYNGLKESFDEVDSTGVYFDNPYCTPHERNMSVFICRKPKFPKEELLERARFYY